MSTVCGVGSNFIEAIVIDPPKDPSKDLCEGSLRRFIYVRGYVRAGVLKSRLNDEISIHDYNMRLMNIQKPYRLGLQEVNTSFYTVARKS